MSVQQNAPETPRTLLQELMFIQELKFQSKHKLKRYKFKN